jgi:hypothetical protein
MKTKNINQIAGAAFATAVILFASFSVNAASVKNAKEEGIRMATERLDAYNKEIEAAVKFVAPSVEESAMEMEAAVAEANLDGMISTQIEEVKYASPSLKEDFSDFQVNEALQSLDNATIQLEQDIRYAPAE